MSSVELLRKLAKLNTFRKSKESSKIAKNQFHETPVGDEEDSSLGDFVEDKMHNLSIQLYNQICESTTKILASLTPREESFKDEVWDKYEYGPYIRRLVYSSLCKEE